MSVPLEQVQPIPAKTLHPLAIISLVCGVLAWFVAPFVGALAAIVTGHWARHDLRKERGQPHQVAPPPQPVSDQASPEPNAQGPSTPLPPAIPNLLTPPAAREGWAFATIGVWLGWIHLVVILVPSLAFLFAIALAFWLLLLFTGLCG